MEKDQNTLHRRARAGEGRIGQLPSWIRRTLGLGEEGLLGVQGVFQPIG